MVCGFHHSGWQLARCNFDVGTWMLNTAAVLHCGRALTAAVADHNLHFARLIVCMDDMVYVFLYALLYLLSCAAGRWQYASIGVFAGLLLPPAVGMPCPYIYGLHICSACWLRDLLHLTKLQLHVSRLMI